MFIFVEGNLGNKWHNTSVTLNEHMPFHVAFVGERGSTFASDLAIDDVSIVPGRCYNPNGR